MSIKDQTDKKLTKLLARIQSKPFESEQVIESATKVLLDYLRATQACEIADLYQAILKEVE